MGCAEEPKPSVCLAQVQVVSTPAAHSACELQNCWELLSSRLLCSTWQVQQQKSSCTHTVGDLTVLSYFSPSAADSISLRATLSKNQTVGSLKKKNRNTSSEMVLQSGFVFFFFLFFLPPLHPKMKLPDVTFLPVLLLSQHTSILFVYCGQLYKPLIK